MEPKRNRKANKETSGNYFSYFLRFRIDHNSEVYGELVNVETNVSYPFRGLPHLHKTIDELSKTLGFFHDTEIEKHEEQGGIKA